MWKPTMNTSQTGSFTRALEHRVGEIDDRVLGEADVPDLALLLSP